MPPQTAYRISELELASRLSFFLWSSIPDEELLTTAEQGKLRNPAVLQQQVKRMLKDPRSQVLVTNFGGQWLYLRELRNRNPDLIGGRRHDPMSSCRATIPGHGERPGSIWRGQSIDERNAA